MRQLDRLSLVDDEEPSAHEGLESTLRRRLTSGKLVVGMPRAGELGGGEAEQEPPRCLAFLGKEPREDGVRVAGESAGDAAQGVDPGRGDDPALAVPRFPDLREHELQERQAAERRRRRRGELPDEAVRLEPEALGGGRTGDGLAEVVLGEAAEQVEGAGDELAQGRQRGERPEEVVARSREEPDAVVSGGELGERGRHGGRLLAAEGDELLELIDEDDDAALVRELALDLAGEPRGIVAEQLLRSFRVVRLERVRQGGEGTPPGNQPGDAPRPRRPESAVVHRGNDASEAERRLADAGIARDQHEGLHPHPLDEREAVSRPAEEERAVLGLEGLQAAVRISLGQRDAPPGPCPLERLEELVGGGESLPRIAAQAAIDRGGEAGVQVGDQRRKRRRVALGGDVPEQVGRDVVERPAAGAQLEDDDAERVEVRSEGQRLPAPGLRRDVVRRSQKGPFGLLLDGGGGEQDPRQPEIDDLDLAFVGDEDVRRLQVAMQDAAAVGGGEAAGEAFGHLQHAGELHRPRHVREGAALDVLGDEVGAVVHAPDPVQGGDVRVLDAGRRPGLDQEVVERSAIGRLHELQRHQAVEERVVSEIDAAVAALAERPEEPVLGELVGGDRHDSRSERVPPFRCRRFHSHALVGKSGPGVVAGGDQEAGSTPRSGFRRASQRARAGWLVNKRNDTARGSGQPSHSLRVKQKSQTCLVFAKESQKLQR